MILYYTEDVIGRGLYFVVFETNVLYHYSIPRKANKHKRISPRLMKSLPLSYEGFYNSNKSIQEIISKFYPDDVFTVDFIKLSK